MIEVLVVMGAGAVGALSRWSLDLLAKVALGGSFPYGTLIANVLGCLLFGIVMQLDLSIGGMNKHLKLLLTTGFLGAFTTFSTFGYHTHSFIKNGELLMASLNIGGNLILGIFAVYLGTLAGKLFI